MQPERRCASVRETVATSVHAQLIAKQRVAVLSCYGPVAVSCEHGEEPLGSIKGRESLERLSASEEKPCLVKLVIRICINCVLRKSLVPHVCITGPRTLNNPSSSPV
jgi:hypothetical protein